MKLVCKRVTLDYLLLRSYLLFLRPLKIQNTLFTIHSCDYFKKGKGEKKLSIQILFVTLREQSIDLITLSSGLCSYMVLIQKDIETTVEKTENK